MEEINFTLLNDEKSLLKNKEELLRLQYKDILEIGGKTSKEYTYEQFQKDYKKTFTRAIEKGKEFAIIAKKGSELLGLVTVIKSKKGYPPRLGFIFIAPEHRRKGISTKLKIEAFNRLKKIEPGKQLVHGHKRETKLAGINLTHSKELLAKLRRRKV